MERVYLYNKRNILDLNLWHKYRIGLSFQVKNVIFELSIRNDLHNNFHIFMRTLK
jgi:hypothetical protein